jgi:hypothetical protein
MRPARLLRPFLMEMVCLDRPGPLAHGIAFSFWFPPISASYPASNEPPINSRNFPRAAIKRMFVSCELRRYSVSRTKKHTGRTKAARIKKSWKKVGSG